MQLNTHKSAVSDLRSAIDAMNSARVSELIETRLATLRTQSSSSAGGWLGDALYTAHVKKVPFVQLRPVLEELFKIEKEDRENNSALQIACEVGNTSAFLWLIEHGLSLNFTANRKVWMEHTSSNPGWLDEGKLLVYLRKKRAGPRLACDTLALALWGGRPVEAMQKAWNGGFMADARPRDIDLFLPTSMREAFYLKKSIEPDLDGWKVSLDSWEFLCEKVGIEVLTRQLPNNSIEKVLCAAQSVELQVSTPGCVSTPRQRL